MNNLRQFEKYDINKKTVEVMEHINFIEELIKLEKYDYIALEARKILEILLIDDFRGVTLNRAIMQFSKNNSIPLTIEKSLMFIKEKGNEAAHSLSLFEKSYGLESDIHSVIEIKKNLFIILRYFVELTSNFSIDISTIKFERKNQAQVPMANEYEGVKKTDKPFEIGVLEEMPSGHKVILSSKKTKKNKESETDEDRMKSLVRMVGMSAFINYFMEWNNFEKYSEKMIKETKVSFATTKIKASGSKSIVKQGYAKMALEYISKSKRVDYMVAERAKELLRTENY